MSSINNKLSKLKQIKDDLKNVLVKHNANPTDNFTTYPSVFDKVIENSGNGNQLWNIRTSGGNGAYLFAFNKTKNLNLNPYVESFSDLTTAENMFERASCIELIMQNADFSKVTTMDNMFASFATYNNATVDLSGIQTSSKLTNMSYLCQMSGIKTLNISGINTSYVTNMNSMFYASNLLQEVIGEIDCSRVSYGLYAGSYSQLFYGCKSLKRINLTNIYKNCTLTNASKWSINLADTILEDNCLINIMNELPALPAGYTNIVLTLPPTNTLTDEQKQIAVNKNWTVLN